MERNKQYLAVCLAEIEHFLGWGASSGWSREDFERLSESIQEKTEVRLSLSTLRRIWGRVRYDNSPTPATLNALARYLGYADWREYIRKQEAADKGLTGIPSAEDSAGTEGDVRKSGKTRASVMLISLVLLIGGVLLLLAVKRQPAGKNNAYADCLPPVSAYPYSFQAKKVTDDLPNSVVFTYDAGPDTAAKVMIQQSWDTARRESVNPRGHNHTSIYYYPGYFRAKLIVNGQIVRRTPVFIQTRGWKGIADAGELPVYLADSVIWHDNMLTVSPARLSRIWQTEQFTKRWFQFANIRPFPGIDGTDLFFETVLRNTATVESSLCRKVEVLLLGTNYPIILPLAAKGCISEINGFLEDTVISGKDHDLSALGCDFSRPQRLKCVVKGNQVRVWLNNELVLELPHTKPMGDLVGVRILFEGPGEVREMTLSNTQGVRYDLLKRE